VGDADLQQQALRRDRGRQLSPLPVSFDPAPAGQGHLQARHHLRPSPPPGKTAAWPAAPLHELPLPDRGRHPHRGDRNDLLPLPLQGAEDGAGILPIGGCPLCHQPPKGDIQLAGGTVFNHKEFVDERGTQCQKCHLDAIQGDGAAPRERCFTCHNQPDKLASTKITDSSTSFTSPSTISSAPAATPRSRITSRRRGAPGGLLRRVHEAKHGGQRPCTWGGRKDRPAFQPYVHGPGGLRGLPHRAEGRGRPSRAVFPPGPSRPPNGLRRLPRKAVRGHAGNLEADHGHHAGRSETKLEAARKAVGDPSKNAKPRRRQTPPGDAEFNYEFVQYGRAFTILLCRRPLAAGECSANQIMKMLGRAR